jgi:protein tyrosine/serine phosphatase
MHTKVATYLRRLFYSVAGLFAAYLAINGLLSCYPNFHVVVPGLVFRSAELSERQYVHYIEENQIKSIINLRGQALNAPWYKNEMRAVAKTGVAHYDLGLNAIGSNSPENLQKLMNLLETAPKPILIHCWRGADRTGLASAIAIILYEDVSLATATQQIGYKFGAVDSKTTGKVTFKSYQEWLTKNHYTHSREKFIEWIMQLASASH